MLNLNDLTPEKLFLAAGQDDILALKTFEELGVNIGQAPAAFIMLFDFSTIYTGESISPLFRLLQTSITQQLERELTSYYLDNLIIQEASPGNDSGIIGAAAICF